MKNIILLLSLTLCLLLSCTKEQGKPYISEYYIPNGLNTSQYLDFSIASFSVSFAKGESFDGASLSNPQNHNKFEAFSTYYGDTNYKDNLGEFGWAKACIFPITGIAVTSDVDFGPHYKAGSLLNDLFSLRTRSFYEFIRHNYNEKYRLYEDSLASVDYSRLSLCQMGFVLSTSPTSLPQGDFKLIVDVQFGPDPVTGDSIVLPPAVFEVSNN